MANPFSSDNPETSPQNVPAAQVTIGQVPVDDADAVYQDSGDDITLFSDYFVVNRFESDKHLYMMPIASPNGFNGGAAAFVQLAAPTLLIITDITASRFKKQPPLPNPQSLNPNWILLDEHYEPVMITYGPDGTTPLYRISCTFVYGHKAPHSQVANDINFGRPPWMPDIFDRTFPNSLFEQGIIDSPQVIG